MARLLAFLAVIWLAATAAGGAQAGSTFSDWSAVVVAGDWHAHDGAPSEGFDNARRDVSAALTRVGFPAQNIRQFSVRPERYSDTRPEKSELRGIYNALSDLSGRTGGGCMFYITSHGVPEGAQLDQGLLRPGVLANMLDRTSFGCGQDIKYPYFDDCFLSSIPGAKDFGSLAGAVRECVRARETAEKLTPPSEPQVWVGAQLRPMLPFYAFDGSPKAN